MIILIRISLVVLFLVLYVIIGAILYHVSLRMAEEAGRPCEEELTALIATIWPVSIPMIGCVCLVEWVSDKVKLLVDFAFAIKNIKLEDRDDN
jgi:hypothetical protein